MSIWPGFDFFTSSGPLRRIRGSLCAPLRCTSVLPSPFPDRFLWPERSRIGLQCSYCSRRTGRLFYIRPGWAKPGWARTGLGTKYLPDWVTFVITGLGAPGWAAGLGMTRPGWARTGLGTKETRTCTGLGTKETRTGLGTKETRTGLGTKESYRVGYKTGLGL